MGGVRGGENFALNVAGWGQIPAGSHAVVKDARSHVRLAPMTGAVENIGWVDERSFYFDLISSCVSAGIALSIGDGTPDAKLLYGIEAVRSAGVKAAVFIKPYSNDRIIERFTWAADIAECAGVDVDSWRIATMRGKASLEQKGERELLALKSYFAHQGMPFALKGIFTQRDVKIAQTVMPDIAYISNHGGRVDTDQGSTAHFLVQNADVLKKCSGELWVDGGVRSMADVSKALSWGANVVLAARPFATALCQGRAFDDVLP